MKTENVNMTDCTKDSVGLPMVRDLIAPSMYDFEAKFPTVDIHSWVDHDVGCIQYYALDRANGQQRFAKITLADWRAAAGNSRPLVQRIFDELSGACPPVASKPVAADPATYIASDLADKIMALINSKPRSPSKDELVGLINEAERNAARGWLFDVVVAPGPYQWCPGMTVGEQIGCDQLVATKPAKFPMRQDEAVFVPVPTDWSAHLNCAHGVGGMTSGRLQKVRLAELLAEQARRKAAKTDTTP